MKTITRTKKQAETEVVNWDDFQDGKTRFFALDRDFFGDFDTFRNRARNAAKRRGMKAKTWTDKYGGKVGIAVQFKKVRRKRSTKRKPTKKS